MRCTRTSSKQENNRANQPQTPQGCLKSTRRRPPNLPHHPRETPASSLSCFSHRGLLSGSSGDGFWLAFGLGTAARSCRLLPICLILASIWCFDWALFDAWREKGGRGGQERRKGKSKGALTIHIKPDGGGQQCYHFKTEGKSTRDRWAMGWVPVPCLNNTGKAVSQDDKNGHRINN